MCIKKESLEEHLLNAVEEAILLLFVDNHCGTTPSHTSLPPLTTHGFQGGKELRLGFANASFCGLYAQGKTYEEVEASLLLESLFVSDLERQRFVNRIGQFLEQQGDCSASNLDWYECFTTTTTRHNDLKVEEERRWPNDDHNEDSFVLVDRTRREQLVPVDFYLWKKSLVCCIFRRPFKLRSSTNEKPMHHHYQSVTPKKPPKRPSAKINCQDDVVDRSTTQPTMLVNGRYHFPRSRMEWLDLIDKCAAPVFRGSVLEWLEGEHDAICHWVSHKVPSFW